MDSLPSKYPAALREDHDPFLFLGHSLGLTPRPFYLPSVFGFLRWTSYSCPFCHTVFRRDYWPHNVRLGDGQRECKSCGRVFDDGAREWPELPRAKKLRFYFPPMVLAIAGSFLFCGIFTLFIAPRDVLNWLMGLAVIGVCLTPLVLWSLIRLLWVSRSNQRYAEKEMLAGRKAVEPA